MEYNTKRGNDLNQKANLPCRVHAPADNGGGISRICNTYIQISMPSEQRILNLSVSVAEPCQSPIITRHNSLLPSYTS
ncbi:hypothetical protein VTH06DRAFT_5418 [Thermothelomyces fergusii]